MPTQTTSSELILSFERSVDRSVPQKARPFLTGRAVSMTALRYCAHCLHCDGPKRTHHSWPLMTFDDQSADEDMDSIDDETLRQELESRGRSVGPIVGKKWITKESLFIKVVSNVRFDAKFVPKATETSDGHRNGRHYGPELWWTSRLATRVRDSNQDWRCKV